MFRISIRDAPIELCLDRGKFDVSAAQRVRDELGRPALNPVDTYRGGFIDVQSSKGSSRRRVEHVSDEICAPGGSLLRHLCNGLEHLCIRVQSSDAPAAAM